MLASLPAEGASRAQIAAAIRATGIIVLRAMTMAVDLTRREARASAAEQVAAEVAMLEAAAGGQIAPAPPPDNRQEDTVNAEAAAGSFAAAWTAIALIALTKWARSDGRGGSIQAAIVASTKAIDHRIKRIIATEAARARNDEHRERWIGIKKANPRSADGWGRHTFRRWDARLDRRVCSVCRAHDAEEVLIGEPFAQGHEPGDVHPHCRCFVSVIVFPNAERIDVYKGAA